jgi:ATP synthase protein I
LSHPPDDPGRRRVKRAAASAAGDAYQGAFEAVLAVLVGAGIGYWVDSRWDTTPYGVLTGVVIGFAAMVLRLLRLGRELVPGTDAKAAPEANADSDGDRGPAESPALSDVWRDDATDERQQNERE